MAKEGISGYAVEDVIKAVMNKYKGKIGYQPFDDSKGLTIEALCFECMMQIMDGNAQKHIQISTDDEGNGYHSLFFAFEDAKEFDKYLFHDDVDLNECVILG